MTAKETGRTLRDLRGEIRPEVLAVALGISVQSLYMYERGHHIPRRRVRMRMAAYYGKTQEEIWGEDAPNWR